MEQRNRSKKGDVCNHSAITLGLVGQSLSHSFSKKYFEEKHLIPYSLIEISNIEELHEVVNDLGLDGFNVTIPYKRQIIPLLDELNPVAKEIGAVNTVAVRRTSVLPGEPKTMSTKMYGYNTDATAFLETLKPLLSPHHQRAIILGSGGASHAVAWALKQLAIEHRVVSRSASLHPEYISYDEAYSLVEKEDYNIIVNTTPVGMYPHCNENPWQRPDLLDSHHLCYDLIYNPSPTLFLRQAIERGAKTFDGLAMLHRQADLALEIFSSLHNNIKEMSL